MQEIYNHLRDKVKSMFTGEIIIRMYKGKVTSVFDMKLVNLKKEIK